MQPETLSLKKKLIEHFDHWALALEQHKVTRLDFIVRPYAKETEQLSSTGTYSERQSERYLTESKRER